MIASYNEETDTWAVPHTEDNTQDKPKRHKRTKAEMEEARRLGLEPDRAPSSRKSGLRAVIKDLVETVNAAVYTLPWTSADALNPDEAELLINGIDKASQVSPTLKRWLQAGSALSGWGALIYAGTIIALPRMMRHGLIPTPQPQKQPQKRPANMFQSDRDAEVEAQRTGEYWNGSGYQSSFGSTTPLS